MGLLQRLRKRLMVERELQTIDEAQGLVVIEALLLTAYLDGEFTDEEQRTLKAELAELPWSWARHPAALDRVLEDTRRRLVADRQLSPDEMANRIASQLPDEAVRRKVLTMAAALAYADGIDEIERTFLESLARAFDLEQAELDRIVDRVKEGAA